MQCSSHWDIPLSHSATATGLTSYPTVLQPLRYPTISQCSSHWDIPLSHMQCSSHWASPLSHMQCSSHWAIPLSHSALVTDLSHYHPVLCPLSYPTIPQYSTRWAIPLSPSALPIELSYYPIVLYPLSYPTITQCSTYWAIPLSHFIHLAIQLSNCGLHPHCEWESQCNSAETQFHRKHLLHCSKSRVINSMWILNQQSLRECAYITIINHNILASFLLSLMGVW